MSKIRPTFVNFVNKEAAIAYYSFMFCPWTSTIQCPDLTGCQPAQTLVTGPYTKWAKTIALHQIKKAISGLFIHIQQPFSSLTELFSSNVIHGTCGLNRIQYINTISVIVHN